eukprot:754104-Hanusia_phi.AAC.6
MSETNKKILDDIVNLYYKKPARAGGRGAEGNVHNAGQRSTENEQDVKSLRGVVFTRKVSTLQGKKEECQVQGASTMVVLSPSEIRCPNHEHKAWNVAADQHGNDVPSQPAANRKLSTPYGNSAPLSSSRRQWSDVLGCYIFNSEGSVRRRLDESIDKLSVKSESQNFHFSSKFDYDDFVQRVAKASEDKIEMIAQTFARETSATKDAAKSAVLQVEAMIQLWENEMLRIRERERDLQDKVMNVPGLAAFFDS